MFTVARRRIVELIRAITLMTLKHSYHTGLMLFDWQVLITSFSSISDSISISVNKGSAPVQTYSAQTDFAKDLLKLLT